MGKKTSFNKRKDHQYSSYADRDKLLKELGYESYSEYRDTDLWKKEIRLRVLEKFNNTCYMCKKTKNNNLQVHHCKYTKKNLTGESIEDLTCLCNSCHYKAEYIYRGKKRPAEKRSLEAANKYIEDRASGKKSLRKKRKKKKSRRQKGTGSKYLDTCTVCGIKQHTTRLEWHRAAPPRCVACGGMLERSWDTYLKKQNDQRDING
jgi:hypothetical protein